MTRHSLTTRLGEYISRVLPDAHGQQQKAISDFVLALLQRDDREGRPLRWVRSRRRGRTELSLVRSVVELLTQGDDLWQLLDYHCQLNLEAGL